MPDCGLDNRSLLPEQRMLVGEFAASIQKLYNREFKYLKWKTEGNYLPCKIIFKHLLHILF